MCYECDLKFCLTDNLRKTPVTWFEQFYFRQFWARV